MNTIAGSIVMQKSDKLLLVELQAENMLVNLLFPGFRTVRIAAYVRWNYGVLFEQWFEECLIPDTDETAVFVIDPHFIERPNYKQYAINTIANLVITLFTRVKSY